MPDTGPRKAAIIGALLGACVTLGIALFMDVFLSGAFQGTWREATARDVTRMFGPSVGRNAFVVTFIFVLVMGCLAGFGALLGAAAGLVLNRFFRLLLK